MKTIQLNRRILLASPLCVAISVVLFSACISHAEEVAFNNSKQKIFATPEAAFEALMAGFIKNSDASILDVLGHQCKDIVVQSDKVFTKDIRGKISSLAQEHLRITVDGDTAIAHLGIKDWAYPIPMVKKTDGWIFDTEAGKEEILNRRIGRNELFALKFVDDYDEAQRKYATEDHTGDRVLKYAQKLISTKGKKDGLFWPAAAEATAEVSPLAAILESWSDEHEQRDNGAAILCHGYHFKILTQQGANPPNGKYDYVINGNMIAGFALVAYPADYGTSGIMTFVINHEGIVYEKNLGADTAKISKGMEDYNPDSTWKVVKPEEK